MTRYIKLDEWEKHFDKMMTGCPLPKKTIAKIKQMWIDGMPTADVVEVVRCGECKYMQTDGKCDAFADFSIRPSVSDYCSYGTLKGGEE